MKNIKIFAFLCSVLLTAQLVSAQQHMGIVKAGMLERYKVSDIDYSTFTANDAWFSITDYEVQEVKKFEFTVAFKISPAGDLKSLAHTPEVGVCYSAENENPTVDDNYKKLGNSLDISSLTIDKLVSGTPYYFRLVIKVQGSVFYGEVWQITTYGTKPKSLYTLINGHKFIDLDLPSGLLWAECNIGASNPSEEGDWFAWAETEPREVTYLDNWNEYKYADTLTQYNYHSTKYESDGKTTLEPEDDAATVKWGDPCRTPTLADIQELIDNCDMTFWAVDSTKSNWNRTYVVRFASKKTGRSIQMTIEDGVHEYTMFTLSSSTDTNDSFLRKVYFLAIGCFKPKTSYSEEEFCPGKFDPYYETVVQPCSSYRFHTAPVRPVATQP